MTKLALWGVAIFMALSPLGAAATGPAQSASGSAYGISVTSSLAGSLIPQTPAGVSGAATTGGQGFSSSQGIGPIDLAGIANVGALVARTSGSVDPASGGVTARSQATVVGLSLANGLLTAAAVTGTCTSGSGGSSGSATLAGVTLAGTPLALSPAPNTPISVAGIVTAVLNEQVTETSSGDSSLEVRAIDLQVLPTSPGGAVLEVILGDARCQANGGAIAPMPARVRGAVAHAGVAPLPTPSIPPSPSLPPTPPPPSPTPGAAPSQPMILPTPAQAPAAATRATLAVTPQRGPPGSEITVSASGFTGCGQVLLFMRGTQIGSAVPDAGGGFRLGPLAVQGNTTPGSYVVNATCQSGKTPGGRATFKVARASVHRSGFVTSLIDPSQVSTNLKTVAVSVGIAGGFMVAAFPSELFNSTLDANYAEIRGWFGLGPPKPRRESRLREVVMFISFIILGGILSGLLSPDFGFNRSSAALVLGIAVALIIIMVVHSLPVLVHVRTRHRQWAGLKVLPGTALVAAACVLLSRATHFQPGYLFGLVAGLDFAQELATDTNGRLTLMASGLLLAVGVGAWFLRTPVAAAAARPGASFWVISAEACLAAVFVCALESVVFVMLPMRFLDGVKLTSWKVAAWVAAFGVAVFAFVHVLLQPSSGYVSPASGSSKWVAIALFLGFGLFSIGFWAYFRFRTSPSGAVASSAR